MLIFFIVRIKYSKYYIFNYGNRSYGHNKEYGFKHQLGELSEESMC